MSRNSPSAASPDDSCPLPPSITISAGTDANDSSYERSCGDRSRCATNWAIRRDSTSFIAAKSSCTAPRIANRR
jgi:hypothetical protein